ncbi:hypothetical protein [Effusibacillus consociatus]|uniref:Uncharacterized protein n=1 Tax=Effusibacillus consociatus TaxID=1117041 RepID=A0ABV9Q8M3_9BACL
MWRWVIAIAIGATVGISTFNFIVKDLLLAIYLFITWSTAIRFSSNIKKLGNKKATVSLLVLGATFLGVSATLNIPSELRIALRLLVLSTGWAATVLTIHTITKWRNHHSE